MARNGSGCTSSNGNGIYDDIQQETYELAEQTAAREDLKLS